ncbi:hypothetical protein GCM10022224_064540 [Nonomuraea antimicrobica]|uniref:Uncharacterized protein n=1 Tax=Nonomuraea antimicrobica TaxID=561173 RepID=A0ABP7CK94_9ACTN
MNTIKHLTAATLTAAAVLAPAAVAQADTPYAQASVVVQENGSAHGVSKNVERTWRAKEGLYCVTLNDNVNLEGPVAAHVTPVGHYRHPRWVSISRSVWDCGHSDHASTIAVRSIDTDGKPRNVAFTLTVS